MPCGTQIITGLTDDQLGLAIAAADLDNPRRLVKERGQDDRSTLTIIFDPCPEAADQVTQGPLDEASPVSVLQDNTGPGRFIASHRQDAAKVKSTFAVPMAVTLAQSALETGWGRAAPGNAFFGIKASSGQSSVSFMTHEVESGQTVFRSSKFRAYDSFHDAAMDYGKLLSTSARYAKAFRVGGDPELFAQAVADAGFATDPNYGRSLRAIIRSHGLQDLDIHPDPALPVTPLGMSGFIANAASTATDQWSFFGKQNFDLHGNTVTRGHQEGEDGWFQRIGRFWLEGVNIAGVDGRNTDQPWSAAFISWVMRTAGAGTRFRYSAQHSVYINQGIEDFAAQRAAAGYWTVRLPSSRPAIGDLVCWTRQNSIDYDHQNGGNYTGHSDLVVDIGPGAVTVIGGNVGQSVTRRPLPLDASGFVQPTRQGDDTIIALMKCRLV